MKFSEIDNFITCANYMTHVKWGHLKYKIQHEIDSDIGFIMNPDYQRGHVWTKEQQIAYVEFKLRGGYGADEILTNCPGWMVDFRGPYEVVDGLQRLTAVLAFLNDEIKAFGYYFSEFEDRIPSCCYFVWKVNNLERRKDVLKWYLEINSGGVVHSDEELERVRQLLDKELV